VFNPFKIGALISAVALSAASLTAVMALPVIAALPLTVERPALHSIGQLPPPPLVKLGPDGQPLTPQQIEEQAKQPLFNVPLLGKTILVDPGHGGDDPGAISGGVEEKNVVLNVSLLLRSKLEALGATVDMTRDYDKTLTLQERRDASNRICPDVFVAVHGNSVSKPQISGIETYWFDSRDQKLADMMLDTVSQKLHEIPKWSHARNLFVLDGNDVPATLVEIGYLTNKRTRTLLNTPTYQDKVASALTDTLVTYLGDPTSERGCPVTHHLQS